MPPPAKVVVKEESEEDGDYSDEDFEDYDDEFEDDDDDDDEDENETPPPPVNKPKAIPKSMLPKNDYAMGNPLGQSVHENKATNQAPIQRQVQQPAKVVSKEPLAAVAAPTETPSWMNVGNCTAPKEDTSGRVRPRIGAMNLRMSAPYTANRFEQAPMSEFQLLERNMGSYAANSSISTQTNNDAGTEMAVQTEDESTEVEFTCQVGGDNGDLLAGGGTVLTGTGPARLKRDFDPARLSVFLRAAAQVVTSLLGEKELAKEAAEDSAIDIAQGNRSITSGCVSLPSAPVGGLRAIVDANFSKFQQSVLFVAYGAQEKADMPSAMGGKGLLCIWDTQNTSKPSHILICESTPTKCCFSGHRLSQTVFAATEDNSIVAWDLREPASMHITQQVPGGDKVVLRRPTYSTDGLLEDEHSGAIVSLEAITTSTDNTDEVSFQLAMLDENGGLSIWNVVELSSRDYGGSLQDLSLGVGGKVKLLKSAFFNISKSGPVRALTINFRPGDPNHALIGTGLGYTQHLVRHGAAAHPYQYDSYYGDVTDVMTIEYSPFLPQYILSASNDGSVCLHHEASGRPLHAWAEFTQCKLLGAVWSPSQPHVFFAYTSQGEVYCWDLLKDAMEPCHMQRLDAKSMSTSYSTTEDTSMVKVAFSARGVGHPYMATSYKNGCVSVHTLSGVYSDSTVNDVRKMRAFLEGVELADLPVSPEPVSNEDKHAKLQAEVDDFDAGFDFGMSDNIFGDGGGMGGIGGPVKAKSGRRAR